jgi:hypothetical protein
MSRVVKRLVPQQWPRIQVLFIGAQCGFHRWCGPRPIWMQSHPILYVAYLHRHSLPHHGFCLARFWQRNINFVLDITPEMKMKGCEVGWPWRPPNSSTFAIQLVQECGIEESDNAVIMRRFASSWNRMSATSVSCCSLGIGNSSSMSRYEIPVTVFSAKKNGP